MKLTYLAISTAQKYGLQISINVHGSAATPICYNPPISIESRHSHDRSCRSPYLGGREVHDLPAAGAQGSGVAVGVCRRQGRAGRDKGAGARPRVPRGACHNRRRRQRVHRGHACLPRPHDPPHPLQRADSRRHAAEAGAQRHTLDNPGGDRRVRILPRG